MTIRYRKESGINPTQNAEPMDLDEVQRRFDAGQYNGASSSAAAASSSSSFMRWCRLDLQRLCNAGCNGFVNVE
mgnify:CR=1 FL=1